MKVCYAISMYASRIENRISHKRVGLTEVAKRVIGFAFSMPFFIIPDIDALIAKVARGEASYRELELAVEHKTAHIIVDKFQKDLDSNIVPSAMRKAWERGLAEQQELLKQQHVSGQP